MADPPKPDHSMVESLRRVYLACSGGEGELPECMFLPCVNCGGVVTLASGKDGVTYADCDSCFTPSVEMLTDNPKFLGIVSSED